MANRSPRRGGPQGRTRRRTAGAAPSQAPRALSPRPGPGAESPPAARHPRGGAHRALQPAQFALAESVGGEARCVTAALPSNVVWAV